MQVASSDLRKRVLALTCALAVLCVSPSSTASPKHAKKHFKVYSCGGHAPEVLECEVKFRLPTPLEEQPGGTVHYGFGPPGSIDWLIGFYGRIDATWVSKSTSEAVRVTAAGGTSVVQFEIGDPYRAGELVTMSAAVEGVGMWEIKTKVRIP